MMPVSFRNPADAPEVRTTELVRETVNLARDLVKIEVELAKDELYREVTALKGAAIAGACAVFGAILGVAMLVVALGVFLGPLAALVVGVVILAGSGVGAFVAVKAVPRKPMQKTVKRLRTDERLLKEHLA